MSMPYNNWLPSNGGDGCCVNIFEVKYVNGLWKGFHNEQFIHGSGSTRRSETVRVTLKATKRVQRGTLKICHPDGSVLSTQQFQKFWVEFKTKDWVVWVGFVSTVTFVASSSYLLGLLF